MLVVNKIKKITEDNAKVGKRKEEREASRAGSVCAVFGGEFFRGNSRTSHV